MKPEKPEEWPERMLCVRCGIVLDEDVFESSLGLRFCKKCYSGTIQEKERERSAEIYLKGRCSACGGSLINGYRMSKLGVVYCIPCHKYISKDEKDGD